MNENHHRQNNHLTALLLLAVSLWALLLLLGRRRGSSLPAALFLLVVHLISKNGVLKLLENLIRQLANLLAQLCLLPEIVSQVRPDAQVRLSRVQGTGLFQLIHLLSGFLALVPELLLLREHVLDLGKDLHYVFGSWFLVVVVRYFR